MADEVAASDMIREVYARQQIQDCLMRYARGVDRRDEGMLRSAYHDDAIDDRGHPIDAPTLASAIVASNRDRTYFHFLGNILIELYGDTALVESYFVAHQYYTDGGEQYLRMRGGRYIDRFENRAGAWKIAFRTATDDWNRADKVEPSIPEAQLAFPSRLYPDDRVYEIKQQLLADLSGRIPDLSFDSRFR